MNEDPNTSENAHAPSLAISCPSYPPSYLPISPYHDISREIWRSLEIR